MPSTLRKSPPSMTVADFIAWPGDGSGGRSQLVDGEVCAIPPGSAARALIHTALICLIANHLDAVDSRYCTLSRPPIVPRVCANLNLRTPVLAVAAAPDRPSQYNVPDPVMVIEILTPENAKDVWKNVWAFCTIPSIREIAIVHSTRVQAEVLRRGLDGHWPEEPEEIGPGDTLTFASIGFGCLLSEVYVDTYLGDGSNSEPGQRPRG